MIAAEDELGSEVELGLCKVGASPVELEGMLRECLLRVSKVVAVGEFPIDKVSIQKV